MKRFVLAILLLISAGDYARSQVCYGGMCYPQQPTAPARLVMPIEAAAPISHEAHCRIHVGDGSVGSGTLISKNNATGLVLTCSHLFDNAASSAVAANIIVEFPDGGRFGARLIERDPSHDLAALLIQRPSAEPLVIDDDEPTGVLTACGYGGDGQFRPASGPVAGAVQAIGATFPSLKICGTVRPGDSGGAVLSSAGRLVGVVWGCRDGETYLTGGQPLRRFLHRVWPGRPLGEPASDFGELSRVAGGQPAPTIDWQAWRDEVDFRLAALDTKKQDRGDFLQTGDLNGYAKKSEIATTIAEETHHVAKQIEQRSTSRIESLRTALHDRIEQKIGTVDPGLFSGLSFGKLLAGALGLSGPVALAVIIAGGLAGRRIKRRAANSSGSRLSTLDSRPMPIAVDTPPPPQQTVPESHYVPV